MFQIEEELKKLPGKPGVYIMHGEKDEIIYVGKAVSLKNRVRQYFQSSRNKGAKIEQMVTHISRFEYIITDSELEALVLYRREGRDVYTTVNIPFTTAVFGGEAKVHTIYGDVLCNIKPGTQSGTKIRLRGKGIVAMNNPSVHGDEYATVQIEVPTNLTPDARRKLKEFEQECNGKRRSRGFGNGSAA